MIKKYNRARYREKFRRYRILHFLLLLVFAAAFSAELFWFGNMGYRFAPSEVTFSAFFADLFTGETLLILSLFLLGVTLYAPVYGFVCSAFRGAFSGFCLSVLWCELKNRNGFWLLFFCLLYLLLSAWLFLAYTAFCTTTALQLFSDASKSRQGGERRMYGGTLFYSSFSLGSVNFRFLAGYCLFFLGAVFLFFLLILAFAGLRSFL